MMRSILFVPADRADLVAKAAVSSATMICLDLEDGVAPSQKEAARDSLLASAHTLQRAGKPVAVRLNSELEHISHDLRALPQTLDALVVPKVGNAHALNELVLSLGRLNISVPNIIAMVETAQGLHALEQVSSLPPSVCALCLGTEDFAADLGVAPSDPPIHAALCALALMAARFGVLLLGFPGSIAQFRDIDTFQSSVEAGRQAGSSGGFAIHPAQLEVLNCTFTATPEAQAQAARIVAAFEDALSAGKGAIQLDGKMIDRPVYLAAKRVLDTSGT